MEILLIILWAIIEMYMYGMIMSRFIDIVDLSDGFILSLIIFIFAPVMLCSLAVDTMIDMIVSKYFQPVEENDEDE